jgi:hypothetical protein
LARDGRAVFGMLRESYGEPNARRIQSRDRRFPENDKTSETRDARTFKVILSYYADLEKPFATKKNSKAWRNLIKELDALKSTQTTD